VGGVAVAEHGAGAAGENGRRPAAFGGELAVADCIHTGVDSVQAAGRDAPLDSSGTDPERKQLPAGDDPVLALGERGDHGVRRELQHFCTYMGQDVCNSTGGRRHLFKLTIE
jgi:hypothetical protein